MPSEELEQSPDMSPERLNQVVQEMRGVIDCDWRGVSASDLQSHMRKNFLVPLEVGIDEHVPAFLIDPIKQAVTEVMIEAARNRPLRYAIEGEKQVEYDGPNWYGNKLLSIQQKLGITREDGFGQQLLTDALLPLLISSPQQINPYLPFLVTGMDISSSKTRFLFSSASSSSGVSVMSVARFVGVDLSEPTMVLAVQKTVKYTLGHMLGLPGKSNPTITSSLGDNQVCANICAMRNALSVRTWVLYAEQEAETEECFCSDCSQELKSLTSSLNQLPENDS